MTIIQNIVIKNDYILYNDKKIARFDDKKVYLAKTQETIATFSYEGEYKILTTLFGSGEKFFIKQNDKNIYRQMDLKVVAVSNVFGLGDLARLAVYLYKKNIHSQNKKNEESQKDPSILNNNSILLKPTNTYPQKEEIKAEQAKYDNISHKEKTSDIAVSNNSIGSGGIILFVLFGILFCIAYVVATFIMIPSTWKDIPSMFDNKDWFGTIIILSFFTAGIISLGNLFKKNKPKFLDCLSFLLIADMIAAFFTIIISIIFLIINSSFKFVGLYIIDIPLCILGAISISFQIAFPIAIIIAIITGITCLIKKHL